MRAVLMAAVLAATPAAAQTALTIPQAREVAAALVAAGRPAEAADLAVELLRRDPEDVAALVVLARALRAGGDPDGALEVAQAANRAADDRAERFGASMELAAANFDLGRKFVAQFWLRRAAEVAPTPELRRTAVTTFRAVAAQTPWQVQFEFSVVPSSNVNNGSRAETIIIGGLPFTLSGDAQALSGLEVSAGATARYRFRGIGGLPGQLSASLGVLRVRLSDDAKEQAPDAKGSDYSFDALEFGYGQVLSERDAGPFLRTDLLAGVNWYGGDPLSVYGRAGLSADWQTSARSALGATMSVERQDRRDKADRSAWIARADLRHLWRLDSGDVLVVSGGVRTTRSDDIEIDHDAAVLGLDYGFGRPVLGGATLDFGASVEFRDYSASPYDADGRQDTRWRVAAMVGFPDWDYYGFAPSLTFEGQRVESNVSLYRSEDFGVRLGIRSVF